MEEEFTFGKYAGKKIGEVMSDVDYFNWLKKQDWWREKWEAQVIAAVFSGDKLPKKPKVRPILEASFDFDGDEERPNKVRRLTEKSFERKERMMCVGCSGDEGVRALAAVNKFVCLACGEHFSCAFDEAAAEKKMVWKKEICPFYAKTEEEMELKSENCPEKKGPKADHTSCGCWKEFECQCY